MIFARKSNITRHAIDSVCIENLFYELKMLNKTRTILILIKMQICSSYNIIYNFSRFLWVSLTFKMLITWKKQLWVYSYLIFLYFSYKNKMYKKLFIRPLFLRRKNNFTQKIVIWRKQMLFRKYSFFSCVEKLCINTKKKMHTSR